MHSSLIDDNQFDAVTSVDVSLSDGVDDVLGCVKHDLFILSQLLDQEVVADELIIQDGGTELGTGALHTIGQFIEGADCVITVDDALALLVKTAEEVEGVEGHEAARVERVAEELGERLYGGRLLESALIGLHFRQQELVQGLDVCDHATRGDHALIG